MVVVVIMHYCRTYLSESILKSAGFRAESEKVGIPSPCTRLFLANIVPWRSACLGRAQLLRPSAPVHPPRPGSRLRAQRDSACGSLNLRSLTNMSAVNPTSAFPPTDAQSSKGSLQAGSGASNAANVAKRWVGTEVSPLRSRDA